VLPTPEVVAGAYEGVAIPSTAPPTSRPTVTADPKEDSTAVSDSSHHTETADTSQAELKEPLEDYKPAESATTGLRYRGRVTRFGLGRNRSFGFVEPDLPGENDHFDPLPNEIFVHRNQLPAGTKMLQPQDRVEFSIRQGWNGLEAAQVRFLNQGAAE
jgi:cold shock CspA family protein